ncbi:hypothetical protein AB4Z22_28645, partial [Paenibacillus sp. TAF58]
VGVGVGTGVAIGAGLGVIVAAANGVELVVATGVIWFALQAANKIITLIISTLAFLFIILRSPQVFILIGQFL